MTTTSGTAATNPAIEKAIDDEATSWAKFFGVTDPEQIEGRKQVMRANVAVGYLDPLLPFVVDCETGLTTHQLAEQRAELIEAARLLEMAEEAHANCDECGGEEVPELCPKCFPMFDDARLKRRVALSKAGGDR